MFQIGDHCNTHRGGDYKEDVRLNFSDEEVRIGSLVVRCGAVQELEVEKVAGYKVMTAIFG